MTSSFLHSLGLPHHRVKKAWHETAQLSYGWQSWDPWISEKMKHIRLCGGENFILDRKEKRLWRRNGKGNWKHSWSQLSCRQNELGHLVALSAARRRWCSHLESRPRIDEEGEFWKSRPNSSLRRETMHRPHLWGVCLLPLFPRL